MTIMLSEDQLVDASLQFRSSLELPQNHVHGVSESPYPAAAGKFFRRGRKKLWLKGVTYGTFRGNGEEGGGYPALGVVQADFAAMAAIGVNTVRTYTVPPRWLLDAAAHHGLRLMIGLPWEQHIAFLDDAARADSIVQRVADGVRACAGHSAVFGYAVGNEIPATIVRWHGRKRMEKFIRRLYDAAKAEHPEALVTYVNYPTTEYLQLPFLDFVCFNVYLEAQETLSAYLARLQNLAGERPLVLGEIGLDSRRNGEEPQAESLSWQLRSAFAAGCAGAFVFGWTDEWFRGGHDIEDWDFGITTRDRKPKAALAAVERAYREVPFPSSILWPRMSIVVCSYNGASTIRDTLESAVRLDYPNYEVIVVNDGSTDETGEIAARFGVRVISTENCGLSSARNTGWQAATGEFVAYIDDDAYPDPHWLKYIAYAFLTSTHDAIGGPNIAPPGDGLIADCVANAPGGPVHVLLTDTVAEHIPGCNMAFRRGALAAIGGFDVRFRTAGDDVDVCWRLMENGGTIGFHAGAMDWHHRRNCLSAYWRQQKGYGKAEALLEDKWPERYNAVGHVVWEGRMYGKGYTKALPLGRWHVYQGTWGTASYQSLYEREPTTLESLPLMPEWYLVIVGLALLAALGAAWPALLMISLPLLLIAVAAPIGQALNAANRAYFATPSSGPLEAFSKRVLTCLLHLIQPAARLTGRLQHGLLPWRRRGEAPKRAPWPRHVKLWSEKWRAADDWLRSVQWEMQSRGAIVMCPGNFDRWDLHVRGGLFGAARGLLAIEEHGAGKQLLKFGIRPWAPVPVISMGAGLWALTLIAALSQAWIACGVLATLCVLLGAALARDCAAAAGTWLAAIEELRAADPSARR